MEATPLRTIESNNVSEATASAIIPALLDCPAPATGCDRISSPPAGSKIHAPQGLRLRPTPSEPTGDKRHDLRHDLCRRLIQCGDHRGGVTRRDGRVSGENLHV